MAPCKCQAGLIFKRLNFTAGVDDPKLWSEIVSNKRSLPVPLYILGPVSQAQLSLYPNLDGCEFGSDVCYLGKKISLSPAKLRFKWSTENGVKCSLA